MTTTDRTEQPYDPHEDSLRSWQLAIAELRLKGLREHRFQPVTEAEREYVRNCGIASHKPNPSAKREEKNP